MNITGKMRLAYNILVNNRFLKRDAERLLKASEELQDPKLRDLLEQANQSLLKTEEYLQQRCEAVAFLEKSEIKAGEVKR